MSTADTGRPNQRMRTRKDLLKAAGELLKQGRKPSLDEIAAKALVSRATAYRYFPNVEALLAEATLDVAVMDPDDFFRDAGTDDAVARLALVDDALDDVVLGNEAAARLMLAASMQQALNGDAAATLPARQNRRLPLILAALEPQKKQFTPATRKLLANALALIVGTESMVVIKDVLRLSNEEARKTKRWAIRALVEAARKGG